MNDTLQTEDNADVNIPENDGAIDAESTATAESGAELATAPGENQDKTTDDDKSQDATNRAINKQHKKFRDEERKRIKLEEDNADLKDKLAKAEADKGEIVVPPLPDQYDDDYAEKMAVRDDAIKRQAEQGAASKVAIERQTETVEAANKVEQERVQGLVNNYDKRITTLGLDPDDIRSAVQTVGEYGVSHEVKEFILQHENGPLITKYLAENPIELDDLRNMSIINAALKINSDINTAASAMKPQASNAPDPAEVLNGRGAGEKVHPLIKGATFT